MATITLSVPDKLKSEMDKVEVINWSSVARKAFAEQLEDIEELQKLRQLKAFSSKFKLSDKDTKEFADKINKSVADEFSKEK